MKNKLKKRMITSVYHSAKLLVSIRLWGLLFAFQFLVISPAFPITDQNQRISVEQKNVSLSKVLDEIETKTGYTFLVRSNDVNIQEKVSINMKNETMTGILDELFKNKQIKYEITGENVSVFKPLKIDSNTQKRKVTGVVIDKNGEPIIGANVLEKGSSNGTITDLDGKFSFEINSNEIITVSYIGYFPQEIKYTEQPILKIVLIEDMQKLDEVVVTALGIKKEAKALGYSVSNVKGEDLSSSREVNLANALAGKVSGVFVNRPASGAGGSSKVVIRGNNSLRSNSQPLYVIDGVPISNTSTDAANQYGGFDYGDGISNINPEDIENMSVLKGPNATALYGQRGGNGVILITTKSGKMKKNIGINFSSDFSFGKGLVTPDFQNEYGQGYNGTITHIRAADGKIYSATDAMRLGITGMPKASAGRDKLTRGSWGAKLDGREYEDQYGHIMSYSPQPNTYDFFNTETTTINNLSIDGGTEKVAYRLSASNTHNNGYVPTNKLNRNTFTAKITADLTSKLQVEVMANYIKQNVKNRPRLSDANDNPAYLFVSMPRNFPLSTLKQDSWTEDEIKKQLGFSSQNLYPGLEKTYATNSSTANPYWTIRNQSNEDERDRILVYFRASYTFAPWLKLIAKTGMDYYADQKLLWKGEHTYATLNKAGDIQEFVTRSRETNSDVLIASNFKIKDFAISLNAGGNRQMYSTRKVGHAGNEFIVPNLHVINNVKTLNYIFDLQESAINSLYASGQVGFKNYLFLDISARNDWSSTLPIDNSSFFYPSVGVSFIASDAFNIKSEWLNFLKIRASYAQSGSSGDPYALNGNYTLDPNKLGGITLGDYTNVVIDPNLKNELTTSYETGLDFNLFNNRLAFNLTYYKASTKNQILSITLPSSTTFTSKTTNAGEIQNQGIEFMISGTPIQTVSGFSWETSFNFSRNKNKVVELIDGVNSYILAQDRGVYVVAEPGKPFGQIVGTKFTWLRDEQGNRLINPENGLPLRSAGNEQIDLGNTMPDWLGGFSNTLKYKGFRLYLQIDISQGGKVISQSTREQILFGTTKKTLEGRDGTYVAQGVLAKLNADGKYVGTGVANTKQVFAQDYWNVVGADKENFVSEELLNDLSYISMREVNLSYMLPQKLFNNLFIKNVSVGVYGRNLFYFQRKTDGFSPEASSFNVQNSSLGIESTSLPLMRVIGLNVSIGI